ncbi:MAG: uridine kinase [Elusimicrobiota bacterium]
MRGNNAGAGAGKKPLCILGIGGGSGSGKSWLATYLKRRLGERAAILCQDWYYKDNGGLTPEQAKKLNFDHPAAIETGLLLRHLDDLRAGKAIEAPRYDYATHSRLKEIHTVRPAPLIILEGLLVLHDPRLRERMDLSVFIDCPDDLRLIRRVRRDVEHRRVDLEETLRLYEHCVRPMHQRFIQPSAEKATWVWRQFEDRAFPRALLAQILRLFKEKTPAAPLRS